MRLSFILALAFLFSPAYILASAAKQCESVAGLKLPDTTITLAKLEPAGPFTPPSAPGDHAKAITLPSFCRVAATIRPTSDSAIRFEVWMPADGWNGRFQQQGNGGFAGVIQYSLMAIALRQDYASASTDDGHTGWKDPTWAIGHPEKVIDFGYRAVHLTAQDAKAIVRAFYGPLSRQDYFIGCSDGGREALMEAQRFPDDFDGILVGAPANSWTRLFAGFVWNEQATLDDPGSYLPAAKLPLLQAGALGACDTLDGVKDGVLEDPSRCHFDPATLQCKGADRPDCLTAAQVKAIKKIYAGPMNPRTHAQIFPGYEPGAEAAPGNWSAWITGNAPGKASQSFFGNGFFGDMVFQNPSWNFRTFNLDSDVSLAEARMAPLVDATDPDLGPFEAHGGKLIQYHGWADSAIAPLSSIHYYEKVVEVTGGSSQEGRSAALKKIQEFYRLYMVPGMGHCGGGTGPTTFGGVAQLSSPKVDAQHDMVLALQRWVEQGVAPESIIATQYVGGAPAKGVKRTWLLCPYPEEARWTGTASSDDAAHFVCKLPARK